MLSSLSLSKKLLIMLTLPLVLQLVVLTCLAVLQSEAEAEARRAVQAKKLSETISQMSSMLFQAMVNNNGEPSLQRGGMEDASVGQAAQRKLNMFRELEALPAGDAKRTANVIEAEHTMSQVYSLFMQVRKNWQEKRESGAAERRPLWKKLEVLALNDIFDEIKELGREEKAIVNSSPERQAEFRSRAQSLLLVGGLLGILSTVASAYYVIREVISRLRVMHDNTLRLTLDRPLNAPLSGHDEIAVLDHTFHHMARSLQQAALKERAIVDNAQDIICTIGEDGYFLSANFAAEKMLGIFPDELIGRQAVDLIAAEDVSKTLEYFMAVQSDENSTSAKSLEAVMVNRQGGHVDTLWSAYWSDEDKQLFCVIHDVTARRQADRVKQEVVAMVNHDMRSPLTTLQVTFELLKKDGRYGRWSEEGLQLLERGARGCETLLQLTKDLLDMDRLEAGRLELLVAPCSLKSAVDSAAEAVSGLAHNQKVVIEQRIDPAVQVKADQHRLEQVVANLLANAVKFSPPGAQVLVTAKRHENMVAVSVIDSGPGIPAAMREGIFDRFRQVSHSNAKIGTGLGLAISKSIVEMHGGKIWVESEGRGSRFTFTLPAAL